MNMYRWIEEQINMEEKRQCLYYRFFCTTTLCYSERINIRQQQPGTRDENDADKYDMAAAVSFWICLLKPRLSVQKHYMR
jgi:hypothetical protein